MTIRIAINGLGRIGRCIMRAFHEHAWDGLEIIAVNGPAAIEDHAHLLKYDSVHGIFPGNITINDTSINMGKGDIRVFAERDPAKLPWKELGVDIVLECTGKFTKRNDAAKHLLADAGRVIVSAPCDGADSTIVYGVNNMALKSTDQVISIGSCTTNCLAPIAKVLNDRIGIVNGFMTTIHSYTGDQNILDASHKDRRRARAAGLSMIPTSTGAAKAIGLVLPELAGKLGGAAVRVPTPNVSMVDLTFTAARNTSAVEINTLLTQSSEEHLKGILAVSSDKLVSADFNHNPHSAIADLDETHVVGKNLCRVVAWYDNEWAFSMRMLDAALLVGKM